MTAKRENAVELLDRAVALLRTAQGSVPHDAQRVGQAAPGGCPGCAWSHDLELLLVRVSNVRRRRTETTPRTKRAKKPGRKAEIDIKMSDDIDDDVTEQDRRDALNFVTPLPAGEAPA